MTVRKHDRIISGKKYHRVESYKTKTQARKVKNFYSKLMRENKHRKYSQRIIKERIDNKTVYTIFTGPWRK